MKASKYNYIIPYGDKQIYFSTALPNVSFLFRMRMWASLKK